MTDLGDQVVRDFLRKRARKHLLDANEGVADELEEMRRSKDLAQRLAVVLLAKMGGHVDIYPQQLADVDMGTGIDVQRFRDDGKLRVSLDRLAEGPSRAINSV